MCFGFVEFGNSIVKVLWWVSQVERTLRWWGPTRLPILDQRPTLGVCQNLDESAEPNIGLRFMWKSKQLLVVVPQLKRVGWSLRWSSNLTTVDQAWVGWLLRSPIQPSLGPRLPLLCVEAGALCQLLVSKALSFYYHFSRSETPSKTIFHPPIHCFNSLNSWTNWKPAIIASCWYSGLYKYVVYKGSWRWKWRGPFSLKTETPIMLRSQSIFNLWLGTSRWCVSWLKIKNLVSIVCNCICVENMGTDIGRDYWNVMVY